MAAVTDVADVTDVTDVTDAPPDEEVENKEDDEDDARKEARGEDDVLLPLDTLEGLVQVGGGVARGHAHENEEQQHGRHQPAAVGR